MCLPPYEPENGGYTCHPAPCRSLSHATVIEYFCDEGFILKGDYKYLTCLNGEWDDPMQISCVMDGGKRGTGGGITLQLRLCPVSWSAVVWWLLLVLLTDHLRLN